MLQVPLSDEAWQKVSHLFHYAVTNHPGRPRRHPRAVLDAILWVHVSREKWHRLPATYPLRKPLCRDKFGKSRNSVMVRIPYSANE
ncbi:transposase [Paraburkholderia sp. IW21]|uniref:transposase n=1 Tax=Paraburkholderia sp. IW21 TaxID=3242488 RepID=UPI00351F98E5